jgi:hypothetical protein
MTRTEEIGLIYMVCFTSPLPIAPARVPKNSVVQFKRCFGQRRLFGVNERPAAFREEI